MMSSFLFYGGCIAFACGIFFRSFFIYGLPEIVFMFAVSLSLAVAGRRKSEALSAPRILGLCVLLFLFACGSLRMEIASWNEVHQGYEPYVDSRITIEGIVIREPDIRESSQHLYVRSSEEVLLITTDLHQEISYGDKISASGELKRPLTFETDLGRTFNYKGYLQAAGVNYTIAFATVAVIEGGHGNVAIAWILEGKHMFMANIEAVIRQPHVGLGEGLLLGVKQALGEELETVFRKTGIMHIVVLSGYNIMLVVVFVMYLLAFVLPLKMRLLCGGVAILLFALMVGLSATVIRASVMAVLILVAKGTGRTYAVVRALAFTGIVMLVLNPYLLAFDVGFQLSFLATLGLILVAPHLEKYVGFMPTHIGLRGFLTATLATQLFVLPILLYQIGEFSVVSVIVNVLVLPMVPVAMLLTFITGMVGFASTAVSLPFAYLSYLSLQYILFISENFARLPFAAFTVPAFPFYIVVALYALIAGLLWRSHILKNSPRIALGSWTIVEEESVAAEARTLVQDKDIAVPIFFR